MTLWTVMPVKPFDAAKSRLAPVLDSASRRRLAHALLAHALPEVCRFAEGRPVLVVSPSAEVLAMARAAGALGLPETGPPDLNRALQAAADYAVARGAGQILSVSSDLPFLEAVDLEMLERLGQRAAGAIAPDRAGIGTNALLLPSTARQPFRFGQDSLRRHLDVAAAQGLTLAVANRPGLAFDLDLPADLADMRVLLAEKPALKVWFG